MRNPAIERRCSFCGKAQDQVQRLIAGPGGVYICNECVDLCQEIIGQELSQVSPDAAAPPHATPACLACGQPMTERAQWGIGYAPEDERWRVAYWLHENCFRRVILPNVVDHLLAGGDAE